MCQPLYNDKPWIPGSEFPCKPCECNNHADSCHYNSSVDTHPNSYQLGGGGVCDNCQHNTSQFTVSYVVYIIVNIVFGLLTGGQNCETCAVGFYRQMGLLYTNPNTCIECQCDPNGSTSTDCVKVYVTIKIRL